MCDTSLWWATESNRDGVERNLLNTAGRRIAQVSVSNTLERDFEAGFNGSLERMGCVLEIEMDRRLVL